MELDDLELKMLKELVPYKILSPTPLEIICYIKDLNRENELLNNRIDKAIEYINKEEKIYEINKSSTQLGCIDFIVNTNDFKNRIIDILRGEDNE